MSSRILVVDDEAIILQLATMVLTSRGFEVLTAHSGQECLEIVEQESPDLVLLDYMMPVMDGMTTLRHLRQAHPDTYVIMLTGKGSEQIAVDVMKAGAADYILKPFKNQDLVERIENVLRIRRIEIHNRELREERERLLSQIEGWNLELERRVAEKTRELELAHNEILQAEKLAALGHVSAGMAHEIRNPLNAIGLFAQILKPVLAHDAEKAGYIDKLLHEVDRIDGILSKLLDASKGPQVTLEPVCLVETIDRILETFSAQLNASGVSVDKHYEQVPPPMMADKGEVEQIFTNLFANSLYEMQHGGALKVGVRYDGYNVTIEVSDTGGGIPRENLSKIFDPFFTTKTKGTGFGLSVVLRIVKSYKGHINVRSTEGEGTIFNLEFPLALETT
ncbi:response receiver histidine kinase [Syntrophotalea carbinolica DSM 2380]|uniref:histidine kinase n=1 Tax=Syntrophotalea carbinolica (strain DSM 2380 / NBRC 103641 / GraBd1) TaxID=338963 RepID=Q3A301_SYNC1|nr:response regulator [Syntrophotalea carbinolica]ABA89256.1 response receiver histidine kinase [Syntrophotalea carbinolica DSM 2380]